MNYITDPQPDVRKSATHKCLPVFRCFGHQSAAVCYTRASACLFSGVLCTSPGSLLQESKCLPVFRCSGGQSRQSATPEQVPASDEVSFFFNSQWPVNAFGLAEETPTLKTLFFPCCTPTRMLMIYLSATSPDNHSLS